MAKFRFKRIKLKDYRITKARGFYLIERKMSTYFLGVPIRIKWAFVAEWVRSKKGSHKLVNQEFFTRDAAVNFINKELESLGSEKRYK